MGCPNLPSAGPNTADLPAMLATLQSYECLFGPYSLQALTLAAQIGPALWAAGDEAGAQFLLEHAVKHLSRYGDRAAPVRTQASTVLNGLLATREKSSPRWVA